MRIPFANRTADVLIPAVAGQPKVTVKSVIDEFQRQFPEGFQELFEAFVLLSPRLVRVTCKSSRAFEEFKNSGVSFRGSLIQIKPCRSEKETRLSVEVVTLNCQGLRSLANREALFSWLNCCRVDFLCLQETHSVTESEFSSWLKTAKENDLLNRTYSCLSSPGTNRSCGVAIVYSSKFTMSSCTRDDQGRVVGAQFSAGTTVIQVCNICGPNTAKEGKIFFESLYSILDPSIPCVLCGDFNTVVDASSDRRGCNIFSPWAYNWSRTLVELMETYGLQDVWRLHHPDTKAYTWYRSNSLQASRLDMFWLCSFLLPFIMSVEILPFFRSDHRYVYLKLVIPNSAIRGIL